MYEFTVSQAMDIARAPHVWAREELEAALDVLRREIERREALELEEARLRAHGMWTAHMQRRLT